MPNFKFFQTTTHRGVIYQPNERVEMDALDIKMYLTLKMGQLATLQITPQRVEKPPVTPTEGE